MVNNGCPVCGLVTLNGWLVNDEIDPVIEAVEAVASVMVTGVLEAVVPIDCTPPMTIPDRSTIHSAQLCSGVGLAPPTSLV